MSQINFAPSLINPTDEKDKLILGLSPSTLLMIVVGLVAFGIIYNYEKKD
jgi:hypothetical protein